MSSKNTMAHTWDSMYAMAAKYHPDPAKVASSALKMRERTLAIDAGRRKMIVITGPPPPLASPPMAQAGPPSKKKERSTAPQCTARTLEGRQCPFRIANGCGAFCKKHFSME
jgi:hypothetical protein